MKKIGIQTVYQHTTEYRKGVTAEIQSGCDNFVKMEMTTTCVTCRLDKIHLHTVYMHYLHAGPNTPTHRVHALNSVSAKKEFCLEAYYVRVHCGCTEK